MYRKNLKWIPCSEHDLVQKIRGRYTSGIPYREMELSKKLPSMSEDEQLALLATEGMLVKRPLVVGDGFVLTGFKEEEWKEKLL